MSGADPHSRVRRIAFSFPAASGSVSEVRHLIMAEAQTLPFSPEELDDIALAVSEAFTNLVQHSAGFRIRGVCEVTPRQIDVTFEVDQGISKFMERKTFPAGLSHSGRGIPLLHMLIPIVEVRQQANGTAELHLVKPVSEEKESA